MHFYGEIFMVKNISEFKKTKPLLVCIDSDGCAMNTMESKHRECFGPMAVKTWPELQAIESEFLDLWNEINLLNLKENILPTRERASLIMTKSANHSVNQVRLRK